MKKIQKKVLEKISDGLLKMAKKVFPIFFARIGQNHLRKKKMRKGQVSGGRSRKIELIKIEGVTSISN